MRMWGREQTVVDSSTVDVEVAAAAILEQLRTR
jgi:hypothetical protein